MKHRHNECHEEAPFEEMLHNSQPSRASHNRIMRKGALVQTLLILSLGLWQQKLQTQAAAPPETTAPSLKQQSQAPSYLSGESVPVGEDDFGDENDGTTSDNLNNWAPVETVNSNLEPEEEESVLERYYDPQQYVYREDSTGSRTQSHEPGSNNVNDDIIVVAAVDGTIAGISSSTGKTIWRRSGHDDDTRQNLFTSKQQTESEARLFDPLLSTTTTTSSSSSDWRTSAVPSIDGKVHLTAPLRDDTTSTNNEDEEAVEDRADVTVTTTASELVSRAPFVDNRGRIYTGTKRSFAVAIDQLSGAVLQIVAADSQCCSDPFGEDRQVVWLGRVDHTVSIQDPQSGAVDVQFSSGQIMNVNDMVLGSGTRQPWYSNDPSHPFLIQGDSNRQPPMLLATPNGILAYADPETGKVVWVAEEFFDSPPAFAVDAEGRSLQVNIVPDATMPNGSAEYIAQEIERQLKLFRQGEHSMDGDQQTIIGTLPTGQLYAMPLGGPLVDGSDSANSESLEKVPPYPALGTGTTTMYRPHDTMKPGCRPGSIGFPACLIGTAERRDPFSRPLMDDGFLHHGSPPPPLKDGGAVVPFYHPSFGYIPPEHFYTLNHDSSSRKYKKLLRILGSWLPPTVALIFVVSFELGRRKRQKDRKQQESVVNEIMTTNVDENNGGTSVVTGGVIQVFDDVILGYGGHGTVVYKGMLEGRQVAVKRMLKAYHASADREISLLIESDGHPNVVRYFLKEIRGDFVYLALELCDLSLHDLIVTLRNRLDHEEGNGNIPIPTPTKAILYQIACGVRHLHHLRIVHRDMKPQNILLADSRTSKRKEREGGESVFEVFEREYYIAKISDMGLGKQLIGQSSYGASLITETSLRGHSNGAQPSLTGAGPGSVGWQAPEVMALRASSDVSVRSDGSNLQSESIPESSPPDTPAATRTSRSVDIFSLGCIFYSTLVPGSHPFGEWYEREANIMHNKPCIDALLELSADAHDLVSAMIQRDPSLRPTAKQICEHPFFWSPDRRLSFLCDFSDKLEMEGDESSRVAKLLAIEQGAKQVVGISWDRDLDDELVSNVQKFRTYDPSSVRDLLRLIRNKHHHFDELPAKIREQMESKTEGLLEYFEVRFPNLLIHCYRISREMLGKDDPLVMKYSIAQVGHLKQRNRADGEVPAIAEVGTETRERDRLELIEEMESQSNGDKPPNLEETFEVVEAHPEEETETQETNLTSSPDDIGDVVIWYGSTAAKTFGCRGWNRSDDEWVRRVDTNLRKRESNLVRCATDPKFRTRLCNHWDANLGTFCPMKKKNKCVFAHGPVELRVKDGKRNRWGRLVDTNGDCKNPNHSGGEDTYGAARSIESERKQEGKWNTDNTATSGTKGKPKAQVKRKKKEPTALACSMKNKNTAQEAAS